MDTIKLPTRDLDETFSLSKALNKRISCRNFTTKGISLKALSNILWAADGINDKRYGTRRTVPSAGASYPIELYLAVRDGGVYELDTGIYRYNPIKHQLEKLSGTEVGEELTEATYNQGFLQKASVNILIASKNDRTRALYAERGDRYVLMEAGGVSQNIHLEAIEQELGTVLIGAFDDTMVQKIFDIEDLSPLIIMPLGKPEDKNIYK
jgi:SagB-type dehydrogenase family enzyme